ncbi:MAG: hypothetical protein MUF14_06475 [Hyphomonadaceae bacterium]|jgi:hypothetical protein|nr:hypothetical protein [Hyphomonadaceae bacterium]
MNGKLWAEAASLMRLGAVCTGLVWLCAVTAVLATGITLVPALTVMMAGGGVFAGTLACAAVIFSARARAAGLPATPGSIWTISRDPARLGPAGLAFAVSAGVGWALLTGTGSVLWLLVGAATGAGIGTALVLVKRHAT